MVDSDLEKQTLLVIILLFKNDLIISLDHHSFRIYRRNETRDELQQFLGSILFSINRLHTVRRRRRHAVAYR